MESIRQNAVILIVVALVIGAGLGYTLSPEKVTEGEVVTEIVYKNPLDGITLVVPDIWGSDTALEYASALDEDIIKPDINEYFQTLGYDIEYEMLLDSAQGQAAIHLEKVQSYHTMETNLIVGGRWSSQAQASLAYLNENNMLLVSPESTSPLLSIPDDMLFRLECPDTIQAPILSDLLRDWGIDAIIIFHTGDAFGDGMYNILSTSFESKGGVVIEQVRVAIESQEFSTYLNTMDNIIGDAIETYGVEHVGVATIFTENTANMITQIEDYPNLMSVLWFGPGGGRDQRVIDMAAEVAVNIHWIGAMQQPPKSWKWDSLASRYESSTGLLATNPIANAYDSHWVVALSVLEAGSLDASDVAAVLPTVASNFMGASGWCDLDETGDRNPQFFTIWGYALEDGEAASVQLGEWSQFSGVVWDEAKLEEYNILKP